MPVPEFLVDACVVSYNTKDLTLKTLTSLRASLRCATNIIVWDNASKDGSRAALAEHATRNPIQVILSPRNVGYGTSLNRAFATGKAPYVLCLNSDMEFPLHGWLDSLVQFLGADEKRAVVGPLLIDQLGRCGGAGVVGNDRNPQIRFWQKPLTQIEQHLRQPKQVLSVCGACMLIKRSVFEEVGGFNESFRFYYEETSASRLIRAHGYQVWFNPASRVVHLWNQSPNPEDATKAKLFQESKTIYESLWGDGLSISET